jgi:sugar O-acyltransferase (sialic acid O-acetyltransferase NeuD family)
MTLYGIVEAGAFGRDVMPLARYWISRSFSNRKSLEFVFVVENNFPVDEKKINEHRVVSLDEFLAASATERYFNIAIGNSQARERIRKNIPDDLARPFSIFAPSHVALDGHHVGEGAILCNFTHIGSNVKIGQYFHGNIYSSVAHDCRIGNFVTFATGEHCLGGVVVEDHAYIGAGAVIRNGTDRPIIIGRSAVIGMGAVVTKSVRPGITVVGNPARPYTPNK